MRASASPDRRFICRAGCVVASVSLRIPLKELRLAEQTGRSKTLLVADDSKATQKVVALTFEDEGWRVIIAGDADEAWRQLEANTSPDIVLADVYMPGGGGLRLCERIRADERFRLVPVILLVGTFEPFDRAEARRVGADDLLTKPFQSIREIVGRVGNLFGGRAKDQDDDSSNINDRSAASPPHVMQTDRNREQTAGDAEPFANAASVLDENNLDENNLDGYDKDSTDDRFADQSLDDQLIEAVPAAHFRTTEVALSGAEADTHNTPETLTIIEPTDELDQPDQMDKLDLPDEANASAKQSVGSNVSSQQVAQTTQLDPNIAFSSASSFSEHADASDSLNRSPSDQNPESRVSVETPHVAGIDMLTSDASVPSEAPNESLDEAAPLTNDTRTMTMQHTSYNDRNASAVHESITEDTLLDLDDSTAPVAVANVSDDFVLDLSDNADNLAADDGSNKRAPQSSVQGDALEQMNAGDVKTAPQQAEIPVSSIEVQTYNTDNATLTERDDADAVSAPIVADRALDTGQLSTEVIEQIARRAVEMMSERVVQEIAWEVVPQLAELLIKQRLEQEKPGKE